MNKKPKINILVRKVSDRKDLSFSDIKVLIVGLSFILYVYIVRNKLLMIFTS